MALGRPLSSPLIHVVDSFCGQKVSIKLFVFDSVGSLHYIIIILLYCRPKAYESNKAIAYRPTWKLFTAVSQRIHIAIQDIFKMFIKASKLCVIETFISAFCCHLAIIIAAAYCYGNSGDNSPFVHA